MCEKLECPKNDEDALGPSRENKNEVE